MKSHIGDILALHPTKVQPCKIILVPVNLSRNISEAVFIALPIF